MDASTVVPDPILVNTQIDEYYEDVKSENIELSIKRLSLNPYPGLRPFRTSESPVFFGRQDICLELIKRMSEYNFLAVIGASGTGKSSLIRAGLLPKLQSLPGKFGEWRVAIFRPGQDPFANLGRAATEARIFDTYSLTETISGLKESSFGFEALYTDASQSANQAIPFNTFIIVDQFEELFRYRRDNGISGQNDAALFVKMLISISENKELNAYVLLTMRTEYLNDCVQILDLAEKINKGQFLVPGLNINQLKESIILPLMLTGAQAEEGIENKIISELGEVRDQLPVLQHALRAAFDQGKKNVETNKGCLLNFDDYKAIGKIQNALNLHADELYQGLNKREKYYCKLLFQCLTERTGDGRLIRRPTQLRTILNICLADGSANGNLLRTELEETINHFRADDVCFLMPPYHVPLSDNTEIDISHESLMRNWTELRKWIDEEAHYGNLYKFLNETRKASEKKPNADEWITGGKLDDLIEWRDHYTNNTDWAARYTSNNLDGIAETSKEAHLKNLAFLEESKKNDEARIQNALDLQNKIESDRLQSAEALLKNRRRNAFYLFALFILAGVAFIYVLTEKNREIKKKTDEVKKDSTTQVKLLQITKIQEAAATRSDLEAKRARQSAKIDSENAEVFFEIARKQQLTLKNERIRFNNEKESIIAKQAEILSNTNHKNDLLQNQLYADAIKNDFQNSKISSIATLDSSVLNDAALYGLTLIKNGEQKRYKNFLSQMNSAFDLNTQMDNDPIAGLREIKKNWSATTNPVIQKLILAIINNHLYYKQRIITSNNPNNSYGNRGIWFLNNIQNNDHFAFLFVPDDRAEQKDLSHSFLAELQVGQLSGDSLVLNNSLNSDIFQEINYLQFTGDQIVGANHKTLFRWNEKGVATSTKMKSRPNEDIIAVSNDGKYIISRYSRTADSRLWNTADYISGKNPVRINNTTNITFVKFAPNDKYVLFITYNGIQLYDFEGGHLSPKLFQNNPKISPLYFNGEFTSDGDKLFFYSNLDKIYLTDLNGAVKDTISVKYPNNKPVLIKSVSLSSDYKTMIIEDYNRIYVLNRQNREPVLSVFNHSNRSGLKFTPIPDTYIRPAILDNSSFITYDKSYNLYLWKIYKNFPDLHSALSSIELSESIVDKLSLNKLTFKQALSSNDKNELAEAANYYYNSRFSGTDTTNVIRSKAFYNKLLGMNGNSIQDTKGYAQNIVFINDYLFALGIDKNFASNVNCLKENIVLYDKYFPQSANSRTLSTCYGNLSWNLFFIKDFKNALAAAKKGLQIDPTNGFIITNLALGYLFTRDFRSAEQVYSGYKDKNYNINIPYRLSFKEDFRALTAHGIINPEEKEIYTEVQSILKNVL